jgi:hypothetical protein
MMITDKYKMALDDLLKTLQAASNRYYQLTGFVSSQDGDEHAKKTFESSIAIERDQLVTDIERSLLKIQHLEIPIL